MREAWKEFDHIVPKCNRDHPFLIRTKHAFSNAEKVIWIFISLSTHFRFSHSPIPFNRTGSRGTSSWPLITCYDRLRIHAEFRFIFCVRLTWNFNRVSRGTRKKSSFVVGLNKYSYLTDLEKGWRLQDDTSNYYNYSSKHVCLQNHWLKTRISQTRALF